MKFTKMHGIGNDYVYVNCFEEEVKEPGKVSEFISDRHFGIGSDGLILICPSEKADCRMDMYNADGSRGKMCGNGIRCVGKYAYDHGLVPPDRRTITVETLAGIKTLELQVEDGKAVLLTVDMGKGELTSELPEDILIEGVSLESAGSAEAPRDPAAGRLSFVGINVGNPHAIYFTKGIEKLDLEKIGPSFEFHERFQPERVNTEFIEVVDKGHLNMRVWERGSGETWACGTGATASVMAAILMGYAEDEAEVKLRGGCLKIRLDRATGHLFMTGPATEVFSGSIDIPPEIYYD